MAQDSPDAMVAADLPPNDRPAPEQKHTVVEHKRLEENDDGGKKGGLGAHLKKHWVIYTIGIGGATLIVAIIALNKNNSNGTTSPIDTSGYYSGSGTNVPQGGFSGSDTSLESMLQGLVSVENQNYNLLQQIASGKPASSNNSSNPSTSNQNNNTTHGNNSTGSTQSNSSSSSKSNNSNWVQPAAIGTSGMSTNAWFYTVKPGDTLSSIVNKYAPGWNTQQPGISGASFAYNYRNNAAVLQSAGVSNSANVGNVKLPTGLRISL